VVANLLLLDVSMNTILWALRVEILMAPVIVLLYFVERRWGTGALVAIALVTTVLSFSLRWALWPPLSRNVFPFVLGMLIPTLGRGAVARLSERAVRWCALAAVLALVLPGSLIGFFSPWSALIEAYGAVVLVALVAYRPEVRGFGFLDARPWRLVGLASGSYYVLHTATIPWARLIAERAVPGAWSVTAPALVGFMVLAAWLVALSPLMLGVFHLVEAPGIALGRWLLRRRRPHAVR
jgi:peptidoglycan/LPS O-acetylase OafA/YrhL